MFSRYIKEEGATPVRHSVSVVDTNDYKNGAELADDELNEDIKDTIGNADSLKNNNGVTYDMDGDSLW